MHPRLNVASDLSLPRLKIGDALFAGDVLVSEVLGNLLQDFTVLGRTSRHRHCCRVAQADFEVH